MRSYLQTLKSWGLRVPSVIGFIVASTSSVLAENIAITNYGHSSLLIEGGGQAVLLNPFKAVGCAAGLPEPKIKADIILASSWLADEGAQVASGKFLVNPGSYRINGLKVEGFAAPHDRLGGRRYGQSTVWFWEQGGLSFAHLGGTAARLNGAHKVLIGRPDVLIIGVGGGAKVYRGKEAAQLVKELKAKHVIPVQYSTERNKKDCDQNGIEEFLENMEGAAINKPGNKLVLSKDLDNQTTIEIMH